MHLESGSGGQGLRAEQVGVRGAAPRRLRACDEAGAEGDDRGGRGGSILPAGGDEGRDRGDRAEVPALALGAALDGGEVLAAVREIE